MGDRLDTPIHRVETGETIKQNLRDLADSQMHEAIRGFVLCHALFTFTESRLREAMSADGVLDVDACAAQRGFAPDQLYGLLGYLASQQLFVEQPNRCFRLTEQGRATMTQGAIGFLRVYRGGYGHLMANAEDLLDGTMVYGRDAHRDGKYVGLGASEATRAVLNEVPIKVIEGMGGRTVADLGCGAGTFLIDFVRRSPHHRGIGVDHNPAAMQEAADLVAAAGLSDRIQLVLGDAFNLASVRRACSAADAFYSNGMEHELLRDGDQAVLDHIDTMAELFPGKCYLIGEPLLERNRDDGAFYWFHVLSKQGIPRNVEGWVGLLRKLKRARLEAIHLPDHGKFAGYFDIRF